MALCKERPVLTAEQRAMAEAAWPEAVRVAGRFARRCPSMADDFQGAVGVAACLAAQGYDPRAGMTFRAYHYSRCQHACLDLMREQFPLGFRRKEKRAGAPRVVSFHAGCRRDHDYGASQSHSGGDITIQSQLADDSPAPGHDEEAADEVRGLARGLPRRHREAVVRLYLDAGTATMKAAGAAMGVCETRVSQVHKEALALLRERLGARREAV